MENDQHEALDRRDRFCRLDHTLSTVSLIRIPFAMNAMVRQFHSWAQ
jgi:hypothetical protein